MDLTSFIIGLVVAWIIALLIYWFGVERDATEKIANTVPLNEHLTQVQEAEDRIAQLQSELQKARQDLEAARAEAQAERERLQAGAVTPAEAGTMTETPSLAETGAAEAAAPAEPSDLKRIEGIGPQIEEILNNAGIHTFQQLAHADVERLNAILDEAGERYRLADPSSWPQQARLAADEQWGELEALQDELKGGRQDA